MNPILFLFKDYLIKEKVSILTLKNYIADINKFLNWFETNYGRPFEPQDLTPEVIKSFSNPNFSPRSLERYVSTLRRFATFLTGQNLIASNPFTEIIKNKQSTINNSDPWNLKEYKNFLYTSGAASATIKNYMVDIAGFTSWLASSSPEQNTSTECIELINSTTINAYIERLTSFLNLSPRTVSRKLSSLRKYLAFAQKKGLEQTTSGVNLDDFQVENNLPAGRQGKQSIPIESGSIINNKYSNFPPFRLAQKTLTPYLALEDLIARKISSGSKFAWRSDWYKRYHALPFVHYLHLAVLVVYASIIGFMLYTNLFTDAANQKVSAAPIAPPRVLSFQGRLTDAKDNPISVATDVRFIVYNEKTASGAALLWQDMQSITPDANGVFQVLLGANSNTIPSTLFREHDVLYLGITIKQTPELTPRQRIATVPFATNAESVQGMIPITAGSAGTTNVLLALDSSGNLTIGGSAAPTFQASGGQFKLSGQPLILATNSSSNANIQLVPDGTGLIDLQKGLVNTTTSGSIAPGGIEINDRAAVFATESAVAAFIVNNNTTGGDIFAASSSGTTRFVLTNTGDLSLQPGVSIDTLTSGTISIGATNGTTLTLGRNGQGITIPGFTGQNGALYGTYGTGVLAQATSATSGLCLTSGAQNPTWAACGSQFWNQSSGILYPNNSTVDFLIGGQASTSAKFAVLNVNGTGPATASVSGNFIVMPTSGAGGTLGIGTTSPAVALHINSTADTNIFRLQDSDGTCDHNPESGAETVTCSSDERLKSNIVDSNSVLSDLMKYRIRTYTVNASGDLMTGVIAQEVQENFPDRVHQDSRGYLMVEQPSPWILLKGIQELSKKISNLTTQSLVVATDSVSIAGQSLNDYIQNIVEQVVSGQLSVVSGGSIVSPLASIDRIHTNVISPLGNTNEVRINGKLVIASEAKQSQALLDVQGSASISGSITADSLQTTADATIGGTLRARDATISGTLYANNINANSIAGLDARIATLSARTISMYHEQLATSSSTLMASLDNSQLSILTSHILDIGTISSDFGTFRQGLIALGPATFSDAAVLDRLAIGTNMILGESSINTTGTDLEIQPLRQGAISFLAGLIRIEIDGTLKVAGNADFASNVTVRGKLSTNIISPLANDRLVIARSGSDEALLKIATGSSTLHDDTALDVRGAVLVSGSGTFSKLNLSLVEPAYAISDTEVVATGSAGTAFIKSYRTELTIYTPHVTDESLIYITPVGPTSNQVLYLLRQVAGVSFTIGTDTPAATDRQFNWIIVN